MGILRLAACGPAVCGVAVLSLMGTGCTQKDFLDSTAQNIMQQNPIHLDAEQVTLTNSQVDCGVQNDLWDPPSSQSADRTVARLTQAGRDLHFDDDVVTSEPGYNRPYVQVRGDFMMQLADGLSTHENGKEIRLVEGKLSVLVPHTCFQDPLPVMGVRKGRFTSDTSPVIQFKMTDTGWHFDKLVH